MHSSLTKKAAWYFMWLLCGFSAHSAQIGSAPFVQARTAAEDSYNLGVSGDGKWVLFASSAENLASMPTKGGILKLYLRDMQNRQTRLISQTFNGNTASISHDGRLILFSADDASTGVPQIYKWQSETVTLVSKGLVGGPGNGPSLGGQIDSNGLKIIFQSRASNLTTNLLTGIWWQVYVADIVSGKIDLISLTSGNPGKGDSHSAVISEDGRDFAFISDASNLLGYDSYGEVLVRNGTNDFLSKVSTAPIMPGVKKVVPPLVIADKSLFFWVIGTSNQAALVKYNFLTTQLMALATNGYRSNNLNNFTVSRSGRLIAYTADEQIFAMDLATGMRSLVSASASGVPGDRNSTEPYVSADGKLVAFTSEASNLHPDSFNTRRRVYIKNLQSGVVTLATTNRPTTYFFTAGRLSMPLDGSFVVFDGNHHLLVSEDHNESMDVFTYHLTDGEVELISARDPELPTASSLGQSYLESNAIDANGRFMVFVSSGSDFGYDRGMTRDLILLDTLLNVKTAISSNNLLHDFAAHISPDGQHIFYSTRARVTTPVDGWQVVNHHYDRISGLTSSNGAYSVSSNGWIRSRGPVGVWDPYEARSSESYDDRTGEQLTSLGQCRFRGPVITPDGQFLLGFWMPTFGGSLGQAGVFRAVLNSSRAVHRIPLPGSPVAYTVDSFVKVSADSKKMVFAAKTAFPPALGVYITDVVSLETTLVVDNSENPHLNGDGSVVVYQTENTPGQIVLTNISYGTGELISRDQIGFQGNDKSSNPSITADSRYVIFASKANNLVANDHNGRMDIFVHDRFNGQTILLSVNSNGTQSANNTSYNPVLGQDGRTVLFQSFATDIVPNDFNGKSDIFYVRLNSDDSDNDGLPDDWEIAHFGNLNSNGTGDADEDGLTNLQEYRAGTSPTNNQSVFTVMTLSGIGTASKTLIWATVPGKSYIVQSKDRIEDPWTNLSGVIPTASTQASFVDETSAPNRFYRVVLVE